MTLQDARPPGQAAIARPAATIAWERFVPSWPVIVFLAALGRLLAARTALLNDPDTYLHIAAGRWILAHHALPLSDPFSHSMAGAAWLPSEWLAEIIFAATYDRAGWGGVTLLSAGCAAAAAGLLMRFLLRRLEPLPALIAAVASAALLLPHALARPHVLILPLLVVWAGALLAARDAGGRPPFLVLPIMILWANLHGSFMFGLALAAYLAGEAVLRPGAGRSRPTEARQWTLFLIAATTAALLAPFGVAGLEQPVRLIAMPALQAAFSEWLSPDFQKAPALELWLLGAVALGFASGVRLPASRLLLLLGLMHMALQHVRHADLLALVGPLAVAAPLGGGLAPLLTAGPSRLRHWFSRLARPASLHAAPAAVAIAVAIVLPAVIHPMARSDDAVTPATALAAATLIGLVGPLLNSETFGGYLVFRGVPTFIDGRVEMYGNDFLAEDFKAERGDAAALQRILARYHIEWTLLQTGSGIAAAMDRLPGWQRVYADDHAVVDRRLPGR